MYRVYYRIKKSHFVSVTYSDSAEHDPNIKMMNSLYIKGTRIRCGNSNLLKSSCTTTAVCCSTYFPWHSFCFFNKLIANGCVINITSFLYCHLGRYLPIPNPLLSVVLMYLPIHIPKPFYIA